MFHINLTNSESFYHKYSNSTIIIENEGNNIQNFIQSKLTTIRCAQKYKEQIPNFFSKFDK